MKKNIKAFLIGLLLPIFVFTQVQFRVTSPTTINNILPFYSQALLSGTQVVTLPFTRPTLTQGGVPTNLNIDTSYDNLDDTTYETNPIFDLGRVINTNLTLANGNWQNSSFGNIWSLQISIDNALNTSLQFDGLSLSPTANFYILNGDIGMVKGPYTADELPTQGVFGTFPMNGQSCYLFLQETDLNNLGQDALTISGVVAGVQTIDDNIAPAITASRRGEITPNGPVSNDCVPSIKCFDYWMTAARAVSRWSNGAGSACSGTLLNNEKSDGTSYFYSAHHCLPGNISDLRFASFQFQYWQSGCNTNVISNGIEFNGAILLNDVGYNDGDAILLKLTNGPGVGDGVSYAGWSRSNDAPLQFSSAIIHHPKAGDMRFTQTRRVRQFWWNSSFWKASYSLGVMLPGSSGAALLNENQQVIGTLSRGTSSCFWNFLGDRFGKFNTGWDGMQQYLSPLQDNFDFTGMSLYQLSILGSTTLDCATGPQDYSVPNLIGCSYTWTTSSNLSIQSGQNTSIARVFFDNSSQPSDIGWVNVVIIDSKGSIPSGRRVELRKNIPTNNYINQLIGTYSTNTNTKPIQTVNFVPSGFINAQYQWPGISNISVTLASGSSSGTGFYSYGNSFNFALSNGQTININFTGNGACGPVNATRTFVQSSHSSYTLSASPNPAKGSINVTVTKVVDTLTSINLKIQPVLASNSTGITKMYLYNLNTNSLVKQWTYQEMEMLKYKLNLTGIKSGYYILKMERDNKTTTIKILIQ